MYGYILFILCLFFTSCGQNNSFNRGYVITQSHEAEVPTVEEPAE